MEAIRQQFFNLSIMEQAFPLILAGLKQTIIICLIVIPLGLAGGLAFALSSLSRFRTVRWTAIAGIDFFRAIPPLVLLIFVYSGLPFAGFRPSPMMAALPCSWVACSWVKRSWAKTPAPPGRLLPMGISFR